MSAMRRPPFIQVLRITEEEAEMVGTLKKMKDVP